MQFFAQQKAVELSVVFELTLASCSLFFSRPSSHNLLAPFSRVPWLSLPPLLDLFLLTELQVALASQPRIQIL